MRAKILRRGWLKGLAPSALLKPCETFQRLLKPSETFLNLPKPSQPFQDLSKLPNNPPTLGVLDQVLGGRFTYPPLPPLPPPDFRLLPLTNPHVAFFRFNQPPRWFLKAVCKNDGLGRQCPRPKLDFLFRSYGNWGSEGLVKPKILGGVG